MSFNSLIYYTVKSVFNYRYAIASFFRNQERLCGLNPKDGSSRAGRGSWAFDCVFPKYVLTITFACKGDSNLRLVIFSIIGDVDLPLLAAEDATAFVN